MTGKFGQTYPLLRERIFAGLTDKGEVSVSEGTDLMELPADIAVRRLREEMEKIRQERESLRKREIELDEEEDELLLSTMMEQIDPLCVRLGITLGRAVDLLQRETDRRDGSA